MKLTRVTVMAAAVALFGTAAAAEGNPEDGAKAFRKCQACHTLEEGGANRIGPNLWGMFSRPVAGVEGFRYSNGMQAKAEELETWTDEALDAYLTRPRDFVPGTNMAFAGIRKDSERADLIAYLKQETGAE